MGDFIVDDITWDEITLGRLHTTQVLFNLNRQLDDAQTDFKRMVMVYKALHGKAPGLPMLLPQGAGDKSKGAITRSYSSECCCRCFRDHLTDKKQKRRKRWPLKLLPRWLSILCYNGANKAFKNVRRTMWINYLRDEGKKLRLDRTG